MPACRDSGVRPGTNCMSVASPGDKSCAAGGRCCTLTRVVERVVLALAQCGGWATRAQLRAHVTERQIDRAVHAGLLQRVGRGRYTLAGFDITRAAAVELAAVISHRSAALARGWSVRSEPRRPELIVPRSRKVVPVRRRGRDVRWRDLPGCDVEDGLLTTPVRTVVDCARDLPLTEALAVADSAIRSGAVTAEELVERVPSLLRSRSTTAELVLRQASGLAANPFESALRALTVQAVGPVFTPQVEIWVDGVTVRPDLVSEALRIVVEADSHEFHTSRAQLVRDCWRYDELTLAGWLVLRFSWDHVMFEEDWVRQVVWRATCSRRATGRAHRGIAG